MDPKEVKKPEENKDQPGFTQSPEPAVSAAPPVVEPEVPPASAEMPKMEPVMPPVTPEVSETPPVMTAESMSPMTSEVKPAETTMSPPPIVTTPIFDSTPAPAEPPAPPAVPPVDMAAGDMGYQEKKSPILKILVALVILLALALGGYYAYSLSQYGSEQEVVNPLPTIAASPSPVPPSPTVTPSSEEEAEIQQLEPELDEDTDFTELDEEIEQL